MLESVEAFLRRVRNAHATCKSYRDKGVVETTFYSPQRMVRRTPFSTRFVRGKGFCFEFRDRRGEEDWDQYVIWTDGDAVHTWWSVQPDLAERDDLPLAIAGATGVSSGTASRVPPLLMPGLFSDNRDWPEPQFIEAPEAAEAACRIVQSHWRENSIEQCWFDSSTLLIRRIVEPRRRMQRRCDITDEELEKVRSHRPKLAERLRRDRDEPVEIPPTDVELKTIYDAAFDVDIDPAELRFDPP